MQLSFHRGSHMDDCRIAIPRDASAEKGNGQAALDGWLGCDKDMDAEAYSSLGRCRLVPIRCWFQAHKYCGHLPTSPRGRLPALCHFCLDKGKTDLFGMDAKPTQKHGSGLATRNAKSLPTDRLRTHRIHLGSS